MTLTDPTMASTASPAVPPVVQGTNPNNNPQPSAKKCPSCGGTDHSRRSSRKCPYFQRRVSRGAAAVASRRPVDVAPPPSVHAAPPAATLQTTDASTTGTELEADDESNLSKPNFVEIKTKNQPPYKPVIDVSAPNFKPVPTKFEVKLKNHRGRSIPVNPTPSVLADLFFPPSIIDHITKSSNQYRHDRQTENPDLAIWKRKTVSAPFTHSCVYQFIAILYYFGIVRLPSRRDYWSSNQNMPTHRITSDLGMTRERYDFLWRHFHISGAPDDDVSSSRPEEDEEGAEEDEDLVEIGLERVELEEEENNVSDDDGAGAGDGEEDDDDSNDHEVWFTKLETLINHVREVSYNLIHTLGSYLSFDEMMIRFMGRSVETHRMKNKPIKEGYKFFVLATRCGFVVNFTPDGRSAQKERKQEYQQSDGNGKIQSMILHVLKIIDRLKSKQKTRIEKHERATRNNRRVTFSEDVWQGHCLAMDNYFTLPKVIKELRDIGVGVVGTARFKRNWPPVELRESTLSTFNEFHWCVDEYGTLLGRWMDNSAVFCVSTLHKVGKIIKRTRKRPRVNAANRRHINKVWGKNGSAEVYIPRLIDDYNHWMGGVDLVDQRIAYYHPDLRCRRNWIPIFLQILSIIRNNSFCVHKSKLGKRALTHKEFTLELIACLMDKAHKNFTIPGGSKLSGKKRSNTDKAPNAAVKSQYRRLTLTCLPDEFPDRKKKPRALHTRIAAPSQKVGACVVCSLIYMKRQEDGEDVSYQKEVKRTKHVCSVCSRFDQNGKACFLCANHFDCFHDT